MKKVSYGAEAVIYKGKGRIVKERIKKDYRVEEIDSRLRRLRTRRESKILKRLGEKDFPAPKLISANDSEMVIEMEALEGEKLRDVLEMKDADEQARVSRQIGKLLGMLHNLGIVHGDLTTSNMILNEKLYLIDFGLSYFSERIEDKAVDLHLLRQALESKHFRVWEKCFSNALSAYRRSAEGGKDVLKRLEVVEGRGRHKGKE